MNDAPAGVFRDIQIKFAKIIYRHKKVNAVCLSDLKILFSESGSDMDYPRSFFSGNKVACDYLKCFRLVILSLSKDFIIKIKYGFVFFTDKIFSFYLFFDI